MLCAKKKPLPLISSPLPDLRGLRRLDLVVPVPHHPVGLLSPVQDELGAAPAAVT